MASIPDKLKKHRKAVLLSVSALPILGYAVYSLFFTNISDLPITVTGTLQAKEIPIASKVAGRISRVCAQEGDWVKAGTTLVEFELPELEAKQKQLIANRARSQSQLLELKNGARQEELARAAATAAEAKARWLMLKNGYRVEDVSKAKQQSHEAEAALQLLARGYRHEDIAQAKAQMEQAKTQADYAQLDFERFEKLRALGAVSYRDADEARTKWRAAERFHEAAKQNFAKLTHGPRAEEISAARAHFHAAKEQSNMMQRGSRVEEIEIAHQQYLQAEANLKLLEHGTRHEQLDRAKAELALSEAQLQEIDAQLLEKRLIAPVDSEVSVMDLHAGEVYPPNKSVITLTRLGDIWTRVYLPEKQLSRIRVGQKVNIVTDAYPQEKFEGKIVQIPGVAEFTPRNVQTPEERSAQVFAIKITVNNQNHKLRGGMNASVELPPINSPWTRLARLGL